MRAANPPRFSNASQQGKLSISTIATLFTAAVAFTGLVVIWPKTAFENSDAADKKAEADRQKQNPVKVRVCSKVYP